MTKDQFWTSQYYLAADEQMQLDLSCNNLSKATHAYNFLVRTTCIEVLNDRYGTKSPLQMIFTLDPKAQSIAIQLDIVDWTTVNPIKIKAIVEQIQASPQLTELLLLRIEERIAEAESNKVLELIELKNFYLTTVPTGITSFTVSKQTKQIVYLFDLKTIAQSSRFTINEKGGKFRFTFTVGFTHTTLIQLYEVSCIMYTFLDNEKLGYYFEFFLDESNYHHQEIYRSLPDELMNHERFLLMVAQIMENHKTTEYADYLKKLVTIFRASI